MLSFPMVDYPSPASFDFLETEEGDDCFNPDSGELMLGDIVISVARARAQAEEYGLFFNFGKHRQYYSSAGAHFSDSLLR